MASDGRQSVGFANALHDLGGEDWKPQDKSSKPRPDLAVTREAAELVGFKSREGDKPAKAAPAPVAASPARRQRHLTGRSAQVNVRATVEVRARFQAIAEKQGWSDAVTFEKAVGLLEKQFGE